MRNKKQIAVAILTFLPATLGAATASAQGMPTQDQSAVRAQADERDARQTQRTDFRSGPSAREAAAVQARVDAIGAAVATLDKLIASRRPARLSRTEASAWNRHTAWLTSVRDRYQALHDSYAALLPDAGQDGSAVPGGAVAGGSVVSSGLGREGTSVGVAAGSAGADSTNEQSMLSEMEEMNKQFVELQEATQAEGRRYEPASNAIRVRHEAAMNAIRSVK